MSSTRRFGQRQQDETNTKHNAALAEMQAQPERVGRGRSRGRGKDVAMAKVEKPTAQNVGQKVWPRHESYNS